MILSDEEQIELKFNLSNELEKKINLNSQLINFEDLVDEILSENYIEKDNEETDEQSWELNSRGGLRGVFEDLNNMFTNLFKLDTFTPTNGYSLIQISNETKVKNCLHRFLVHKSITGGKNAGADGSASLFEEISANSVCSFLGENSQKILVGEGRKKITENVLKEITATLKERTGVYHNLPVKAQDDGVDFIVYKPVDIRNKGNIIILGQACVGRNYKKKPSIYDRWQSEYITFSIRPPITLLSVVHLLTNDDMDGVQSKFSNSLVFDRARILQYFDDSDDTLNNKIIHFANSI